MFKNILKIAGLVLLVSLFFACEEDKGDESTISERINSFESALDNGAYSNIADNFHPDMPSYDSYQDGNVLNSGHIRSSYAPFTFSEPTTSDSGNGIYAATGTFSNNVGSGTYSANMKEDGDNNWKILKMVITVGTTQTIQGATH